MGTSLKTMSRLRDHRVLNGTITGGSLTNRDMLSSGLLVLAGSIMQGYANGTADALFVGFALLVVGFVAVSLFFPNGGAERRAFLLTYGVSIFVGGLAQWYSFAVFDSPQSATTYDSHTFFNLISPQPPFTTMADMPYVNAPLAVLAWQQVYKVTWALGFAFGQYTGVMFNALVMGLAGSVTVRIARELFGADAWRLRRVGTLFAFSGLFILFGSVLLRDSFTTFLNVFVLWAIVSWLVRQTPRSLLFAVALTCVGGYAMLFLRAQAVLLFGVYGILAFLFWLIAKRLNAARLTVALFALPVLLFSIPYLVNYTTLVQEVQTKGLSGYARQVAETHSEDSLGVRFVINQPLPIRVVLGSGSLMVYPIPLWANLRSGVSEYHLIKAYHGIFQVLVLPLVFAGVLVALRMFRRDRKQAVLLLFLAAYLLIGLEAVVVTSLEQRHFAQFMPAFMILAALPDTREKKVRKRVQTITTWWLAMVVLVHLAWAMMKAMA